MGPGVGGQGSLHVPYCIMSVQLYFAPELSTNERLPILMGYISAKVQRVLTGDVATWRVSNLLAQGSIFVDLCLVLLILNSFVSYAC